MNYSAVAPDHCVPYPIQDLTGQSMSHLKPSGKNSSHVRTLAKMSYHDRLEVLRLNPQFMKHLDDLHRYRGRSTNASLASLFPMDLGKRARREQLRQKMKAIEKQMQQVGIILPPSPDKLKNIIGSLQNPASKKGQILKEATQSIPVVPKTKFQPLSLEALSPEKQWQLSKESGRWQAQEEVYDFQKGRWLHLEIDVTGLWKEDIRPLVSWHMGQAKKEARLKDTMKDRDSKDHHIKFTSTLREEIWLGVNIDVSVKRKKEILDHLNEHIQKLRAKHSLRVYHRETFPFKVYRMHILEKKPFNQICRELTGCEEAIDKDDALRAKYTEVQNAFNKLLHLAKQPLRSMENGCPFRSRICEHLNHHCANSYPQTKSNHHNRFGHHWG